MKNAGDRLWHDLQKQRLIGNDVPGFWACEVARREPAMAAFEPQTRPATNRLDHG